MRHLSTRLALAMALLASTGFAHVANAQEDSAEDCSPLSEQYPDLGTDQSISARMEFQSVWASFELPGGPCGYESAEAHYNALLEEAEANGGPTEHTAETMPDWTGSWGTENSTGEVAIVGRNSTREGMAARLNPEAAEIFMADSQEWLDDTAIDPISFCLQPNFPRWFTEYGYREFFVQPDRIAMYSQMVNQLRHVYLDREQPTEDWRNPDGEWLGYSTGFWDDDVLTVLTTGLKDGILQRNMPRQTEMETVERWRLVDMEGSGIEPNTLGGTADPNARLEVELTMYSPDFVEPWHTVVAFYKEIEDTPDQRNQHWITSWDCIEGSNWYFTADGVVSQYAPGEKPPLTDPEFWFGWTQQ
ncbi:hypothetical protein [Pelagibacterium mangrovi]|uniref:hypothetical protein n=1 Tax=Pelagibacterium mangrovi TaxID=3119828 RepID=UPI002FCA7726